MDEPRIVKMKIWELDDKPVFYGYDEDDSVYSVLDREITSKPAHLGMMNCRSIEPRDLSDAMLHNQVTPEDFDHLDAHGLIPDELSALFRKIQELQKEVGKLKEGQVQKSTEEELTAVSDGFSSEGLQAIINTVKVGLVAPESSVFAEIMESCKDLSDNEQKVLELVGSHFGLNS